MCERKKEKKKERKREYERTEGRKKKERGKGSMFMYMYDLRVKDLQNSPTRGGDHVVMVCRFAWFGSTVLASGTHQSSCSSCHVPTTACALTHARCCLSPRYLTDPVDFKASDGPGSSCHLPPENQPCPPSESLFFSALIQSHPLSPG